MGEVEYNELINPSNLYWGVSPNKLYEDWKEIDCNEEDLHSALAEFEKEEMYEHCVKIKKLIICCIKIKL